ncbi:MAG: molybdopterin molybdotransferase [Bacteroidia bacterium]|jgi:molybdopterin molybdotransferase
MISVEEAKSLISEFSPELNSVVLDVSESAGYVLSNDVHSPIDMPPFLQSAMDGYALAAGVKNAGSPFKLIGEVSAGGSMQYELKEGECVRIFTGAPVPESATAVVQQEWVEQDGYGVLLQREVAELMHIRPKGEQMKTAQLALEKGTLITPGTIGFLQMLGITSVNVFAKPRTTVLVTGNELVSAGNELKYGQIYESNSQMLISALEREGVSSESQRIFDNLDDTIETIGKAMEANDLIIITGGISVGDHDHVGTALAKLGVEQVFYKVAQKPGKPLFFGTKEGKAVFALPGNPAASLTCFYEYVLPVLRNFYGRTDNSLQSFQLPLAPQNSIKSLGRAQFLKSSVTNGVVEILEGQSSAMLNTFALANALVYVETNCEAKSAGDLVEVHLLP